MHVSDVLDDLVAEQEALDRVVSAVSADQFVLATPSPRWSVADQLGHLSFFDSTAALAITDPEAFLEHRGRLTERFGDELAIDELTLGRFRQLDPADQLTEWRHARLDLEAAARTLDDDARIEWYGPSMGAKSFITARLMEVWAHGQDIVDAVGGRREPTDRLRHIAQLGFITRNWSYIVRGEDPPGTTVRVDLVAPSGQTWTWGPDDATATISGTAEDFCLVVTQRRNVADTALAVEGADALDWMSKAQAFAGGATDGPARKGTT